MVKWLYKIKKIKLSHHRKRFKAPQPRWMLGPIGKHKTISQQEESHQGGKTTLSQTIPRCAIKVGKQPFYPQDQCLKVATRKVFYHLHVSLLDGRHKTGSQIEHCLYPKLILRKSALCVLFLI